jgi:hypothetical protein
MDLRKIEQTLENGRKYSAIHIIGHGSAGTDLIWKCTINKREPIDNYNHTLS